MPSKFTNPIVWNPDFSNPLVRKTISTAISAVHALVGQSCVQLNEKTTLVPNLGRKHSNMGRWLRHNLLLTSDSYYRFSNQGSKCREYTMNPRVEHWISVINSHLTPQQMAFDVQESAVKWTIEKNWDQLRDLKFKYTSHTCARLWHPLQNIRKAIAVPMWRQVGLPHDYDIMACAPTLILQHARALGMWQPTITLDKFLTNPRVFREKISQDCDVAYQDVKVIVNAMFCGAVLSTGKHRSLFQAVDYCHESMRRLMHNGDLCALKQDIASCWQAIKPVLGAMTTCQAKWDIYFKLERKVLDSINRYLAVHDVKSFSIHDGFRTNKVLNTHELSQHVMRDTNFAVQFSYQAPPADNSPTVYCPNVQDPRVISRIKSALLWAQQRDTCKPQEISMAVLNLKLGCSNHDLGKWLRKQLLTPCGRTGRIKSHIVTPQALHKWMHMNTPPTLDNPALDNPTLSPEYWKATRLRLQKTVQAIWRQPALDAANQHAADFQLPDLQGTVIQINQALPIRHQFLCQLTDNWEFNNWLILQTKAKWWNQMDIKHTTPELYLAHRLKTDPRFIFEIMFSDSPDAMTV